MVTMEVKSGYCKNNNKVLLGQGVLQMKILLESRGSKDCASLIISISKRCFAKEPFYNCSEHMSQSPSGPASHLTWCPIINSCSTSWSKELLWEYNFSSGQVLLVPLMKTDNAHLVCSTFIGYLCWLISTDHHEAASDWMKSCQAMFKWGWKIPYSKVVYLSVTGKKQKGRD